MQKINMEEKTKQFIKAIEQKLLTLLQLNRFWAELKARDKIKMWQSWVDKNSWNDKADSLFKLKVYDGKNTVEEIMENK